MVILLTSVLGAGWVGLAGTSGWLGSLLVLDSKLLGWEEVFFPVEATLGGTDEGEQPFPFPRVWLADACLAWPCGQNGARSKGPRSLDDQKAPAHRL